MQSSDKMEFNAVWAAANDLYGRKQTDDSFRLAFAVLEKLSIDDVKRGLKLHMQDAHGAGQFAPKPADVIRHVTDRPLPKTSELIALAIAKNTPLGIFMYSKMAYAINAGDSFALNQAGENVRPLLPEFIERAKAGNYTDSEIRMMQKNGVDPSEKLAPGIAGPANPVRQLLALPSPDHDPALSLDEQRTNVLNLQKMLEGAL